MSNNKPRRGQYSTTPPWVRCIQCSAAAGESCKPDCPSRGQPPSPVERKRAMVAELDTMLAGLLGPELEPERMRVVVAGNCSGCPKPLPNDGRLFFCDDCAERARAEASSLDNTPAVDQETFLRCSFCQQHIGVRVIITKASIGWLQAAAGTWVSFGEPGNRNWEQLQVRCARCLLPEV